MFPALKKTLIPLVLLALFAGAGVALQPPKAEANISLGVWFLDSYSIPAGGNECDEAELREVRVFDPNDPSHFISMVNSSFEIPVPDEENQDPIIQIGAKDDLIMCVEPANGPDSNVIFDTAGPGDWTDAACGDNDSDGTYIEMVDDDCIAEEGEGDDNLTVVAAGDGITANDMDIIAIRFTCVSSSVQRITIDQEDRSDDFTFLIMCKGSPSSMSLTATPGTVESFPALFNTSHSLLRAIITDASGNPVLPGTEVEVSTTGCGISFGEVDSLDERAEALDNEGTGNHDGIDLGSINGEFDEAPLANFLDIIIFSDRGTPSPKLTMGTLEVDTNEPPDGVPNHSEALVIFHGEGCDPGVYTVTFHIDGIGNDPDVEASADVTVIGPPAFITVTAAPTELICGEKSEITVTVTDVNNRPVSDNTRVEVLTNWGGVFGGTGTSLTTEQPVNPLSSTTVEIFDGSGIAYLLTSPAHHGPYEVLAASTQPQFGGSIEDVPRVVSQVTVTCTLAEGTEIIAPDTGTGLGPIRPPNTGDSGLAAEGVGNGTLLAIAGATFVALAVIARRRFARD